MNPTVKQEQELNQEQFEQEQLPDHQQALLDQELLEQKPLRDLAEYLKEINPESHPTFEDLWLWKKTYGRFYMSTVVEDDDIYLFRPVFRQEWTEFVSRYSNAPLAERQAGLVEKCLLFPKYHTVSYMRPAGFTPSLYEQIMFQSGFVDTNLLLSSIKVIK